MVQCIIFTQGNKHESITNLIIEHTRHQESERKLVDYINRANGKEETPLMIAALRERDELVEIFLKNGADDHLKNEKGWTVSHNACLKVTR